MNPLIQPTELAALIEAERCVVLDCRFDLSDREAGRRAYAHGHIPGAFYVDLEAVLSVPPTPTQGRHPLPDPEHFAAALGDLGVGSGTRVVAYDGDDGAFAARAWWMLRWLGHEAVSVLDGGFAAWSAAGLPMTTEIPRAQPTVLVPAVREDWVVATEDLPRVAGQGLLIDARSPARFRGEQEPIDPVAGHVPGAVNYPYVESLREGGPFRALGEIERRLRSVLGDTPAGRTVVMCGSGVTACHVLLALEAAGLGTGRLYAGSWSEWIRDPDRPVATGPARAR